MATTHQILSESINKNPLAIKEALDEILRERIFESIETYKTEQLDEISTNTLKRYVDKATIQNTAHWKGYGEPGWGTSKTKEQRDKVFNRTNNVIKARDELKNRLNPIKKPKVHDLSKEEDDGDVYDRTQTDDHIKDGDVLKLSGGRAGVLVKAWPVITHGTSDALHTTKGHITKVDKGRYVKSHALASSIATAPELKEENLDEVSARKLVDYIGQASFDKSNQAHEIGFQNGLGQYDEPRDKDFDVAQKKHAKRSLGIQIAAEKLAKKANESVELNRNSALEKDKDFYIDKDDDGYHHIFGDTTGFSYGHGNSADELSAKLKQMKRTKNESVEELDEISKDTLKSYIKKATIDYGHNARDGYTHNYKSRMHFKKQGAKRLAGIEKAVNKISAK